MKWLFIGIGAALAAVAAVGIFSAARANRTTRPADSIDGGVRHYNDGADAPKVIVSTEITEFHCIFSLYAMDDCSLAGGKYECNATLVDGAAQCSIKWYDRTGGGDDRSFTADSGFFTELQKIVSETGLASHNGYSYHISGLPDMYGAKLDVQYASGESIYAFNNQDNFLPAEAMNRLFALFTGQDEQKQQ